MRRRAEEPYVKRPHCVHAHHDQFHVFSRRDHQDLAIGLPGGDAFIGSAPHASFVGQPPFLPTTSCAPAAEKIVSFTSLLKRTTQAPDKCAWRSSLPALSIIELYTWLLCDRTGNRSRW